MLNKIKECYEKDKTKFVKNTALYTGAGVVAITALPYVVAGAGLAMGFYICRKAVGEIEK